MRLIDAHTHFFSRGFFEDLAAQSPVPGSVDERLVAVAAKTGLDLPAADAQAHAARWLAAFEGGGVAHAVTFASLPTEAGTVADAVAASNGRLSGYALVNPNADTEGMVTRAHFEDRGFRGILLFPAMHHVRMSDPRVAPVLDVVADHRGVVVVHCGMLQVKLRDLLGLPRPFDLRFASPLDVIPAANAHPQAHFVIPHFGAGMFRECLMAGAMCENVYVDTSSSNAWMATQPSKTTLSDVFAAALRVFGPERILFGTDSSTFPRGWRQDVHQAQAAVLEALAVSARDQALIFGGNAARLLGLGAARALS